MKPKRRGVVEKFKFHWPRSSWEEVLTASNAAIGGPSTAAAFAVGLIPNEDDKKMDNGKNINRSQYRSSLVIAATFWGVFGYAIATGMCTNKIDLFCAIYYYFCTPPDDVFLCACLTLRCWGDVIKDFNALEVGTL